MKTEVFIRLSQKLLIPLVILILIFILIFIRSLSLINHKNNKLELFTNGGSAHGYGYLNTFYTELAKEKMVYFVEPLPLQGIEPPSTLKAIKAECKQLFEWTHHPTADMLRLRQNFDAWDKNPVQPFLTLIKAKKMKVKRAQLDKLLKDCAVLALKLKMIHNKGRPFQLCYTFGYPLKYLQSAHADTPSFPSSFALQAFSMAYVLGRKYAKYEKNIEKIANDMAWSRVYSGNAYESDISAAKQIVLNLRIYLESIDI